MSTRQETLASLQHLIDLNTNGPKVLVSLKDFEPFWIHWRNNRVSMRNNNGSITVSLKNYGRTWLENTQFRLHQEGHGFDATDPRSPTYRAPKKDEPC